MHAVITGASSGIGEALARELAAHGYSVTLVARRKELLDKLAAEIGDKARAVAHDLAAPDRAAEWLPAAEAAFGPVDVLVNNAGMENTGPTVDADPAVCRKLLDLNLTTPILLTRAILPAMVSRKSGAIVNVASVAGLVAPPMQAYYGASKAGLAMFSETLRAELSDSGVHVLTVYPGPVTTAMGESGYAAMGGRENLPKMPEGTPDVLALRIRRAIETRKSRVIYPRFYTLSRWLWPFARWAIDSFAPKKPVA
jgi:short-subunit dehydrogenase